MPGQLYDKMTAKQAEALHQQGADDYRDTLLFFPARHPFGSPEWLAWSGGVVEAWKAELEAEEARAR